MLSPKCSLPSLRAKIVIPPKQPFLRNLFSPNRKGEEDTLLNVRQSTVNVQEYVLKIFWDSQLSKNLGNAESTGIELLF